VTGNSSEESRYIYSVAWLWRVRLRRQHELSSHYCTPPCAMQSHALWQSMSCRWVQRRCAQWTVWSMTAKRCFMLNTLITSVRNPCPTQTCWYSSCQLVMVAVGCGLLWVRRNHMPLVASVRYAVSCFGSLLSQSQKSFTERACNKFTQRYSSRCSRVFILLASFETTVNHCEFTKCFVFRSTCSTSRLSQFARFMSSHECCFVRFIYEQINWR